MGCASSRPVHHNHRPGGGQRSHHPHKHPQMSYHHITHPPKRPKANTYHVSKPPKPPPPVARGRTTHTQKYAPYNPYDLPYSQRNYRTNGKYHAQHKPQYKPQYTSTRDVSPPRHRNEMPRRNASHRYRDVSPLGSSRFERPFERAYVGRGRAATVGATFRESGIGGWEHW